MSPEIGQTVSGYAHVQGGDWFDYYNIRLGKISIIILLISPALTGIIMNRTGEMWPFLPIGFVIYSLTFILSVLILNKFLYIITSGGIIGGTILHVQMVLASPTIPGRDPPWYFRGVQRIINSGSTDTIIRRFYDVFNGFHVFLSELYLILGSPNAALVGATTIISIVAPISAGFFAYTLIQNSRTFVVGLALTATSQIAVRFSVIPIAQSIHVMTVGTGMGIIILYLNSGNKKHMITLLLIMGIWTASHKLPLFFLIGACIGILFIGEGYHLLIENKMSATTNLLAILLIAGVLFVLQTSLLTGYAPRSILAFLTTPEGLESASTATGDIVRRPLLSKIFNMLPPGLLIVSYSTLALSMLLLTNYDSYKIRLGVGIVGGAIGTCFLAAAGWAVINRLFGSLFPLLFSILGVGYVVAQREIPNGQIIALILFIILTISQAGAAGLALDDPRRPQPYVSEQDMSAKQWGVSYSTEPITADSQFAISIRPNNLEIATDRFGESPSLTDNGVLQQPYSKEDMQTGLVARRNITYYYYPSVYRLYLETDDKHRNIIYNSESTKISQGTVVS